MSTRHLGLLALAAAVLGCAAALPFPQATDVGAAQVGWPGTTQADLERGRGIYLRRCGNCHLLHSPGDLAPAKWPGVVAKMAPRAKLSSDEAADVVRYLVVLAAAPPAAIDFPPARLQSPSVGPSGREKQLDKTAETPQRQWREFVSEKGLHASKTRDAVVDIFLKTKEHIDLQSLFERARRAHPGVGFATVYRTMKLLEEAGIAHTRRFGNTKETLYEVATGRAHHDHLICEQCGRIIEFVSPEVERLQDRIAIKYGFTLSRHRHELYGTCPDCRPRGKAAT